MAIIDVDFKSEALMRNVKFKVILPIEENFDNKFKTLYLLHGMFSNCNEWIRRTDIVSLAKEYDLCVIMPSGDNSYYINDESCHNLYSDYILELVEFSREILPISKMKSDTYIAGSSMGGFGALYNGLRFNNIFSRIGCFSPAIYHEIADYESDNYRFNEVKNFLDNKFKNKDKFNLRFMFENLVDVPSIFMFCGCDDYLLESNLSFKSFLESNNVDFTFKTGDGEHNWKTWNIYLPNFLDWLKIKE